MKSVLTFILSVFSFAFVRGQTNIEWQYSYGGSAFDEGYSIQQTTDSGFILLNFSGSNDGDVLGNHGYEDLWLLKLNSTGNMVWQNSYGGSYHEYAGAALQTFNGGYVICGSSNSNDGDVSGNHGGEDFWVVKLTSTGVIDWQKSLGGSQNDMASSICQTTDSGYVIAGWSKSIDGNVTGHHGSINKDDYWIVKLDKNGTLQWQKSLGGSLDDQANSIVATNDGGFIVAGESFSNDGDIIDHNGSSNIADYWIAKLSSSGSIEWTKSFGGSSEDYANDILQTEDGGFIVAGRSLSSDSDIIGHIYGWDIWVVKIANSGSFQWQRCLGGTSGDFAHSICQTKDGGYVITGPSSSHDVDLTTNLGNSDYWVVKIDSSGTNIIWQKNLGGSEEEVSNSIIQTIDGGYIIIGRSSSNDIDVTGNHGLEDSWIVKLSNAVDVTEINLSISDIQLSPNPISNLSMLSFYLAKTENVSINIFDIEGRLIQNFFNDNLPEGNHQFKVNNLNQKFLSSGIYLIRIQESNSVQCVKMVVIN